MPTKETELGILFAIQENGNAIPLGKINEAHIISADLSEDTDKTIIFPQEMSMSFDFKWNPSIDFAYFFLHMASYQLITGEECMDIEQEGREGDYIL